MSEQDAPQRHKILVIEDNPGDVELLRLALAGAGLDCELTVIDDGGDALTFAASSAVPFDLAVLDLNLPKNDGLEILEAMRANPVLSDMPVALLSSSSSPREQARLEAFRIGRYLTKPSDLDAYLQIGAVLKQMLTERGPSVNSASGAPTGQARNLSRQLSEQK
ncbi:MAG: response regulator [Bryobacteraceae bacterium]|nr:response regulator [Bryobacteraceae bacterium]